MQLRVHAAKLPAQRFMVIRDQVLTVTDYLPGIIMRLSKSSTRKILHAFYNAGICSQHDIMYISSGELENAFRSTRTPAVLGYEELESLSNPGTRVHVAYFS
jgi:hypothetical protein